VAIQLSPERRDALFKLVLAELNEFEDLRQAVEAGDLGAVLQARPEDGRRAPAHH
jgi:hypothetical protein